jgi:catechol 2,3-dioxygenase-like lactoylglutathione lyase family enzyme
MQHTIDTLVRRFEHGSLSRRQLVQALLVLAASPALGQDLGPEATPAAATAQSPSGLMKGRNLHHINVRVSDLAQSEAFYRKLLGFGPSRRVRGPDNHGFDLFGGGLIILQKSEDAGRIDHFCLGVDGFNAERMRAAVKSAGIGSVLGDAADNFSVSDPDGVRVQISAPDWSA